MLYYYTKQRKEGFVDHSISFEGINSKTMTSNCSQDLLELADNVPANLYMAFRYLQDKYFLEFKISSDTGSDHFHNFRITSVGIDIIEGIERDSAAREEFTINFNIKLAENINIESLIKAELESILKASLI